MTNARYANNARPKTKVRGLGRVIEASWVLFGIVSCSVLTHEEVTQCNSTQDCIAHGMSGATCDPSTKLCLVSGAPPDAGALDDGSFGSGGTSNDDGTAPTGGTASGGTTTGGAATGGANTGGTATGGTATGGTPAVDAGTDAATCIAAPPEVCNGQDDDCNGSIDEGCPESASWTFDKDRSALGDSFGGSAFAEQCNEDEVLIGLKVSAGSWVDRVAGVCQKLSIVPDTSQTPYTYRVDLTDIRELAPMPSGAESMQDLVCPQGQVVSGLKISQQNRVVNGEVTHVVIPRVWLNCAELYLATAANNEGYALAWRNPVEIGPVSGSFADNTAWFHSDALTSPLLAVKVHGSGGSWIDRIGLGTGSAAVSVK